MSEVVSQFNTLVVVGDKFSTFGSMEGAATASEFANCLEGRSKNLTIPERVIFGQGISESWINYIKSRAEMLEVDIQFVGATAFEKRTGRSFSHKVNRQNILVTDPVQVAEHTYRLDMCLDDECEIMADHTTGHHIQGMVLIEAARQSFLTVTEWFLLPTRDKYYFVINNFDIRYKKFAFPVPTQIDFMIQTIDKTRNDRVSVEALVSFIQQDQCICEIELKYTAILDEKLNQKEKEMAASTLAEMLKNAHLVKEVLEPARLSN